MIWVSFSINISLLRSAPHPCKHHLHQPTGSVSVAVAVGPLAQTLVCAETAKVRGLFSLTETESRAWPPLFRNFWRNARHNPSGTVKSAPEDYPPQAEARTGCPIGRPFVSAQSEEGDL